MALNEPAVRVSLAAEKRYVPFSDRAKILPYILANINNIEAKTKEWTILVTSNDANPTLKPLQEVFEKFVDQLEVRPQVVFGVSITFNNRINRGRVDDMANELSGVARRWGAVTLDMPRYDELNDPSKQEANRPDQSFTLHLAIGLSDFPELIPQ